MRGGGAGEDEVERIGLLDQLRGQRRPVERQQIGVRARRQRGAVLAEHGEAAMRRRHGQHVSRRQVAAIAPAAMQQMVEPHLAQRVLVLVEGHAVEPDGHAHAAPDHLAHRRDPRGEAEIGAGVGDDRHAALGQQLHLVGAQPHAMRDRQARREQADLVEPAQHPLRERRIRPAPLGLSLKKMHVDAPARRRRALGDQLQKRLRAPLHARGPELHAHQIALGRLRDGLDQRHLLGGRRSGAQEAALDASRGLGREPRHHRLLIGIDERVDVAQLHREADAQAHIARGLRHRLRFGGEVGQALDAGVMRHHRACSALRRAGEGDRRGEPRVHRGDQRQMRQPRLERRADAAMLAGAADAGVIMRVDQRRQRKRARAGRAVLDVADTLPGQGQAGIGAGGDAAPRDQPLGVERRHRLRSSSGGRKEASKIVSAAGAFSNS